MEVVFRSKRRKELAEEEDRIDYISRLPDAILGDIISLLPTKDGARTQVLSSRWCKIWRSAPLNLDLHPNLDEPTISMYISTVVILSILSTHQGPIRLLCIPKVYLYYRDDPAMTLDRWLRSATLDKLEELEFQYDSRCGQVPPLPPLPIAAECFSSTLRVTSFGHCNFLGVNCANELHFPHLKNLSLSDVNISESSINSLLASCPILESLLLTGQMGCSRIQIVSPTLRSIGVRPGYLNFELPQLIIHDAPCLERLLHFQNFSSTKISISVISAPKLHVLGPISTHSFSVKYFTTFFQGPHFICLMTVVRSVKVPALTQKHLSLGAIIEFLRCFPCLEKLYIKTKMAGEKNLWCKWCHKNKNFFIETYEIRLKKIVLTNYRGNKSHVNFAKFFVLNARMLESMRLELFVGNPSSAWIDKQHKLLRLKNKASSDMHLDLVSNYRLTQPYSFVCAEQVHDLSTADPFQRFHDWVLQ